MFFALTDLLVFILINENIQGQYLDYSAQSVVYKSTT